MVKALDLVGQVSQDEKGGMILIIACYCPFLDREDNIFSNISFVHTPC